MKINPLDQIHSTGQAATAGRRTAGQGGFKRILDQAVEQKTQPAEATPTHSILSAHSLSLRTFNVPAFQGAERMLNALERYQHLLGDTQASLRAVEPAIRQVRQEAEQLKPVLAGMSDGDPLKETLGEALTVAACEIARFEDGRYVSR